MIGKKIGFFGGSFDPIHLGHVNLAVRILERGLVDQILFCPNSISPMKKKRPPIAANNHRMNMLQLSLEDVPDCDPCGLEISRSSPSYTIDTVKALEGEIYLVIAEDVAYELDQWKEVDRLLQIAPPIVPVRYGFNRKKLKQLPEKIKSKVEQGMVRIPAMDISSTEIRERLKKKFYCGHLLQGKILDYIHQNALYS